MPALTFDDLVTPQEGQGSDGVLRLTVRPTSSSRALTFDDIVAPETTGAKVGRYAEDIGRSIVSGADKGVAGIAGLPADAMRGVAWVADAIKSKVTGRPQEEIAQEADARALIPRAALVPYGSEAAHAGSPLRYEPQTTAGKYAETAASFVPGATLGPGGVVRNAVSYGVIPGLASEAAGQYTQGTPAEPYARAAAAIGTAGAGMLWNRPSNVGRTVQGAANGVDNAALDAAEALFQEAQRAGTPITRAEALQHVTGGGTQLGNLQRVVEGSGAMRPFFSQRPQQVETAGRQAFDTITPPPAAPSSIGPAVGQAAGDTLTGVRQTINRAAEPFYNAAAGVRLTPQEMAQARALPGFAEAVRAVRGDPQLNRYVANLPDDSVGFLNEVKKYLDTAATNAAAPMNTQRNAQRAAGYGRDAAAARAIGVNASPDYATALGVESFGRDRYLEPLLRGPLGKLAKEDLTTKQAISALFPAQPVAQSAQEIGTAVRALVQQRPLAARELVRAHIESVFNEATSRLTSGANEFGGAKFVAALRGNPQQAQNLEAAVRALPQGNGIWEGFDRFLNILEAQGQRQRIGSQTAFNQQAISDLKSGGLTSEAATVVAGLGTQWPRRVKDAVERWRLGRGVDEIARLLTDPGAGREFRRLANAGSPSQAAAHMGRLVLLGTVSQKAP